MISAGLGIVFRSENFLNRNAPEYKETGRKGCGAAFPSCPAFCGYKSVYQLMDTRMHSVMNGIVSGDGEYLAILRKSDIYSGETFWANYFSYQ